MSNVELIKLFYNAFKNQDKNTCTDLCDDKIQWQLAEGMPSGGTYVGKKAVFDEYFPKMLSNFKEFHAVPEQFTDMKDHVMVTGTYSGISNSGKSFQVEFSHMYHIQDGKITQFRQFTDTQKIQESLT
ncbi:ketosteroid isomerase [Candidatus Nitrosopumilus sp. SW]|uniref:nuclear transport factor 2 family protein n=1 Tax=Candidatus Nitrosopumilus sp. SW TaxID=2508726 RepID=UPI001153CF97|nr:nuclear transport factor 2 family protein [Candidatus Nitrosopumilus sp. SW]QDI88216.1 ketosteroid isomerase [Candidatus Nitrosopumilus sp. SW]